MEVRVRERLIGALVLVVIVVLVVPAILKGRGPEPTEPASAQTRRVEVPIGEGPVTADDPGLVPETVLPDAMPVAVPVEPPPAASKPAPTPAAKETVAATTKPPPPKAVDAPAPAAAKPAPAAAKPAPAVAKPAPTSQTAWAVQLGAYASRNKADRFVSDLRKRGFSAFVLEYRASGKVLYRVRVGPEQDRARAEAIAARLAKEGYQPVVARHP